MTIQYVYVTGYVILYDVNATDPATGTHWIVSVKKHQAFPILESHKLRAYVYIGSLSKSGQNKKCVYSGREAYPTPVPDFNFALYIYILLCLSTK